MQKFIFFINSGFAFALLVSYLAPFIPPDSGSIFQVLSLLFPYLLLLNSVFLLYWLLVKPKYISVSLICLLIGYKAIPRHISLFNDSIVKEDVNYLSVISQNLQAAKYFQKNKRKLDPTKIEEFKTWVTTLGDIDIY